VKQNLFFEIPKKSKEGSKEIEFFQNLSDFFSRNNISNKLCQNNLKSSFPTD